MTRNRNSFCGSPAHSLSRRGFLGTAAAGATALATDIAGVNLFS